ncbi:right-handed parallel beta-helix repeat-containing protein, partial [Methanofollis fontis]
MRHGSEVLIGTLILLALCLAPAASGSAADGFNGTFIHVPADYPSIQAAIDAASDGDRIVVENGTYNEHLDVTASVMIAGVGMPVVNASGTGTAITVSADGVCLSGIAATASGSVWNSTVWDAGIRVLGDDALIENCSSIRNAGFGIYVSDVAGVSVVNATSLMNGRTGYYAIDALSPSLTGSLIAGGEASGVYISSCSGAFVQDNEISDNDGYGVAVRYSTGATVAANTVHANRNTGIETDKINDAVLEGNAVSDNGRFGIALWDAAGLLMQGNVMNGNAWNFDYAGDDPAPKNSIDTSNTVDGLPVVYLEGESGMTIDSSVNAGLVCCVGCDNMSVEGLTFQGDGYGVGLFSTRDSGIEGCTITDTYEGICLSNVSGTHIEGCSITSSGMNQWLLDIDGASNCSLVGNTLEGFGNSSMGLFGASGIAFTENTFRFTGSGDDPVYMYVIGLTNSSITENLLDFSGVDPYLGTFQNNEIYLNDITFPAPAALPASECSIEEIPAAHARALSMPDVSRPDAAATDVYSTSVEEVSTGNIWHSPDPVYYRYDGVLFRNLTGNHWNLYDGTDANDDGIGDSPYIIGIEEQDDYPLMTSFAAYTAPLTIYVPQDVPTIGEALTIAQDGDSIVVAAGTYNESVVINRSVTLSGEGMAVIASDVGVSLYADGAVFEGFTVTGNATETVGIDIAAADVVVRDTVVTGTWLGIGVAESGNLTLSNNTMANNTFNFAYVDTDPSPGNSIDTSNTVDGRPVVYLEGASDVEIGPDAGAVVCVGCTDVLVDGLALSDSYVGCAFFSCTDVAVINITAEACCYGVVALDSEGVLLDALSIDALDAGLMLSGCDGCTVADSVVSAGIGVEMAESTSLAVFGSTVAGYYGVFGFGVENCSLTGNTVSGEIFGGACIGMDNSSVTKNTFSGYLPLLASGTDTAVYLNSMLFPEPMEPEMMESVCQQTGVPAWSGSTRLDGYFQEQSPFFTGQAAFPRQEAVEDSGLLWNSPEERTYRYNGSVHTNFTGNYWSTYNGTDSNGDGIGDEGFEIVENLTDSYPLMERFEGYAAPLALFEAVPTTGAAPLTVRFTDTSANEPDTWSWAFGDGAVSAEEDPVHTYTQTGTYTVLLNVSNAYGADTITGTVTVTAASGGGGSSSSSSAGSASSLSAGTPAVIPFRSGTTPVSAVEITPAGSIPSVLVTADSVSLPSDVPVPSGEVYDCLQIQVYHATDDEIASGVIDFSVSKAWLDERNLSPEDIAVWRYHDGVWERLKVEVTGESGDAFTFRAETPGFSYFAITALPEKAPVVAEN